MSRVRLDHLPPPAHCRSRPRTQCAGRSNGTARLLCPCPEVQSANPPSEREVYYDRILEKLIRILTIEIITETYVILGVGYLYLPSSVLMQPKHCEQLLHIELQEIVSGEAEITF